MVKKFLLVALIVFVAAVAADVSHLASESGYNYDHAAEEHHHEEPAVADVQESYLPPSDEAVVPIAEVSPQPNNEYLAPEPALDEVAAAAISTDDEPEPAHVLADDGYHYRTIKRFRYRYRH